MMERELMERPLSFRLKRNCKTLNQSSVQTLQAAHQSQRDKHFENKA